MSSVSDVVITFATEPSSWPIKNDTTEFIVDEESLSQEVLTQFHHKCVHCFSSTVILHHIQPRSRGRKARMNKENLIPICPELHTEIHRQNPGLWEDQLRRWRKRALALYAG